jgi:hypothetical protein
LKKRRKEKVPNRRIFYVILLAYRAEDGAEHTCLVSVELSAAFGRRGEARRISFSIETFERRDLRKTKKKVNSTTDFFLETKEQKASNLHRIPNRPLASHLRF